MSRIISGTAAAALIFVSGAALAAAPAIGSMPEASGPPTHHMTTLGARQHEISWQQQERESREMTEALNRLEAAGYIQVQNLRAEPEGISATASKDGKSEQVTVTPLGQIEPSA